MNRDRRTPLSPQERTIAHKLRERGGEGAIFTRPRRGRPQLVLSLARAGRHAIAIRTLLAKRAERGNTKRRFRSFLWSKGFQR